MGCPFIGRPFDDDWGLADPTGLGDEAFIEVIRQIEGNIRRLREDVIGYLHRSYP